MTDADVDPVTWFRELRPLLTILLTAVAGGITTFCSVDRHAQRSAAQELALKREQFQAEELAKYLSLPMKEAVTKRVMATYLQAAFYSKGELEFQRWATRQIDQVDRDTLIRRTILADRASELKDAQARRDVLLQQRTDLELKLATATLSTQNSQS